MLRIAIVLLLSVSCCLVSPSLHASDKAPKRRESRERDRDAARDDERIERREKEKQRERRKKRKERKPKDTQSEKQEKESPDDDKPKEEPRKQKKPPREKKPEDKKPEDKKPEDKKPEDKKPEDKKPEDKKPEDKKPEDKPAEPTPADEPSPQPKPAEPTPAEPKPVTPPVERVEPLPDPAEKVEAAKPEAEPAKPAVESSDIDFQLQGEYLGNLSAGPHVGRTGLQVVALGDGKFDVYVLQGGLPGNGWVRNSPRPKLSGQREGDRLVVHDERLFEIDGQAARVNSAEGRPLGQLKKVLRRSPTMGAAPAAGAKIIFAGRATDALKSVKVTDDGLLGVGALTKDPVGDFRMHVEFRTPFEPTKRGQGRGNSGIYIQERYEVQVLDSFGLAGDANECGGLYRQRQPDYNLCLPPMSWQTYDIHFRAARFDAQGNKMANARITVFHNGIAVHDDVELTGKTGAGQKEEPTERPIRFQDHGNAVVYRNIWLVDGVKSEAVADAQCCDQ